MKASKSPITNPVTKSYADGRFDAPRIVIRDSLASSYKDKSDPESSRMMAPTLKNEVAHEEEVEQMKTQHAGRSNLVLNQSVDTND